MAVSLDTGVPWVMCQQNDAPNPIVSPVVLNSFTNLGRMLVGLNQCVYICPELHRSTLAMGSTVTNFPRMLITSQRCGQRTGVDGR